MKRLLRSRIRGNAFRGCANGQSFVELALTLPILLMLTMGVIDLGFVLYAHVQVAAASSEGAIAGSRFVVSGDASDPHVSAASNDSIRNAAIRTRVVGAMGRLNTTSPNFDPATDVSITYHPATATSLTRAGDEMTVTVNYQQRLIFNFIPNLGSYVRVGSGTRVRIN